MKLHYLVLAIALIGLPSCKSTLTTPHSGAKPNLTPQMRVPEWAKNAVIYELNTRQFSKEGTLKKAAEALPRIKDLGVDIVWLMPIYPIAEAQKKCNPAETTPCLGSPYAAYDFKDVNPQLGTQADFRAFVQKAHALGLKVILDFIPDHTGWESKWMKEHPEYFVRVNGQFTVPIDPFSKQATDWTDVAMLDYNNPALRRAIIDAHEFWVREFDVDGFREDVAGFIPNDFWAELRIALDRIKPVFMLSEWGDIPEHLTSCFQVNYGWKFHVLIKDIAKGKKNANDLMTYLSEFKSKFPKQGYQMHFTQNHDENTWNGTEGESFGEAGNTFTALVFTFDGMPLIYNGQEASLNKRLSFFHKDEIDWSGPSRATFFQKLTQLKHTNEALWNGTAGGSVQRLDSNDNASIMAFVREQNGDRVMAVFNLSSKSQETTIQAGKFVGTYGNVMKGGRQNVAANQVFTLKPWEFVLLSMDKP
ncbi:MAG: alpha-glucosidase C-terminal domain-containing protein [Bacteroidetes Order II. Incertae sedis bacterium]|nr:alpha-glucosidase C-terminal domain-containing protein [Bacteroidetes Order II. bacterium]